MKKIHILLLGILLILFALPARAQFSGLNMQSYSFGNVHPTGLRGVAGSLSFELNNIGERREIRDVHAVVFKNGRAFLKGSCRDLVLERGHGSYVAAGKVKLPAGVSTLTAITSIMNFDPSQYTVNVSLVLVHEDGSRETIVRKGVPVSRFIKGENRSQ